MENGFSPRQSAHVQGCLRRFFSLGGHTSEGSYTWALSTLGDQIHALFPNRQDIVPDHPLPDDVRERVTHYFRTGQCTWGQMERMLLADFPGVLVDERQVRNFMASLKVNRVETAQCRQLLERLFERQHHEDPGVVITQCLDDEDRMKGVIWVTNEQKQAWLDSGAGIIIHDNTYNLDELGYKLGVFSGISKEGSTVPLGQCFIIDEESGSYEWQLRSFLKAHGDFAPALIITDCDPAVVSVVATVFPNAIHIWCLYHLITNIFRNCKGSVGGAIGQLIVDFITVSKTITKTAFLAR